MEEVSEEDRVVPYEDKIDKAHNGADCNSKRNEVVGSCIAIYQLRFNISEFNIIEHTEELHRDTP